jgi:hypothetical protein
VVAGPTQYGSANTTCGVSRYNAEGSIDTTFDFDGQAFVPVNDIFFCWTMAIQPDGKILVGGDRLGGTLAVSDLPASTRMGVWTILLTAMEELSRM